MKSSKLIQPLILAALACLVTYLTGTIIWVNECAGKLYWMSWPVN